MARRKAGTRASPGNGRKTKKRIARKVRAPRLGLTQARREQAIRSYSESGSLTRTAAHMDVSLDTLWRWRRENTDFNDALKAAGEELTVVIGELARHRMLEYWLSIGQMQVSGSREVMDRDGVVHRLVQEEVVRVNPALMKLALGRLDPRWVSMPKEVAEHLAATFEALAAQTRAELEAKASEPKLLGHDGGEADAGKGG